MESFDDEREKLDLHQARDFDDGRINTLEAKMAELRKIKEELKSARDNATESWLESKPLIDELERRKSDLATAQNQHSISNTLIVELESQFETIVMEIRSKREEELKASKTINEMNRALEHTREELEQLKTDRDEEQRARSKLKQTLRLRRQTLRTLQLTLRAMRMESEAFGASEAEALRYINHPESDNSPVQLTQEDYYALKRRAKEETSLADWRISVAMEQKITAEKGRNLALARLKETDPDSRPRKIKTEERIVEDEDSKQEEAGDMDLSKQGVDEARNRGFAFPKARAKAIAEYKKGPPNRVSKPIRMTKKVTILWKLKSCFLHIKRLFKKGQTDK
ncbi:hypothetical protein COLO4_11369 [Corchorus olitorius]|uniref:WEB family protein n=1 Tax=Corchorus olitorius TaxID=93759 RepID=A0A1R3K4P8_9ROSI|nr:hypothetical protein COLO4_11369 [Corchorus olitorius]